MNKGLLEELESLIKKRFPQEKAGKRFLQRLKEGALTRDENPETHFCLYFAAFDAKNKEFFLGHHRKSGLWLFNGGHINHGEMLGDTLRREIKEEWGYSIDLEKISKPLLLTITRINNPTKQTCKLHYDIWFFIKVNKAGFSPDKARLAKEFHQVGWFSLKEVQELVTDTNTLLAVDFIQKKMF